ncbi:hypothetical protein HX021_05805 [Sphingobacterium sp. N143]|uniref:hypothetical protein n=1 Tax=Sphingobacterium sp. N143 TaxID=2746727 RepID=UPI002578F608|nr:hypothetical protein [Sphingobacterium sp. N143]MDM1293807.1 hypothetical protein [Sphingobacterium sp. N143]
MTIVHHPFSVRQVDLSDLFPLQEILTKKAAQHYMPFLLFIQHETTVAVASVVITANNQLTLEISARPTVPEHLKGIFREKATHYFEHQIHPMFGTEEALKKGIRRFSDWVDQNRNSKLA